MGHIHSHEHSGTSDLKIAFYLNLFFTVIEIFGGLYTNSLAILSDAVHDLGDSMSLGMGQSGTDSIIRLSPSVRRRGVLLQDTARLADDFTVRLRSVVKS